MYDTETSTLIKKFVYGNFGDSSGYEESLYRTESGNFFLYTNGGADSKYPQENIARIGAEKKDAWLKAHE